MRNHLLGKFDEFAVDASGSIAGLGVDRSREVVPEGWSVEEALQHAVEEAGVAQVDQTCEGNALSAGVERGFLRLGRGNEGLPRRDICWRCGRRCNLAEVLVSLPI